MKDQPMCQRPGIYCGKCDTCNPMTREQRIQEVINKISDVIYRETTGGRTLVEKRGVSTEKLAAFLVDEVLPKESDNDYRLPDPHLELLDVKKTTDDLTATQVDTDLEQDRLDDMMGKQFGGATDYYDSTNN